MVTSYCVVSRKGGTRGGGWCHPQGDMYVHMATVVAGCRNGFVVTRWANSCLGCTNVVREHYTYLVGASSYNHNTLTNLRTSVKV